MDCGEMVEIPPFLIRDLIFDLLGMKIFLLEVSSLELCPAVRDPVNRASIGISPDIEWKNKKEIFIKSKRLGSFPPKYIFYLSKTCIVGGENQQFVLCGGILLLLRVTKCKKIGRSESHLMPVNSVLADELIAFRSNEFAIAIVWCLSSVCLGENSLSITVLLMNV